MAFDKAWKGPCLTLGTSGGLMYGSLSVGPIFLGAQMGF